MRKQGRFKAHGFWFLLANIIFCFTTFQIGHMFDHHKSFEADGARTTSEIIFLEVLF